MSFNNNYYQNQTNATVVAPSAEGNALTIGPDKIVSGTCFAETAAHSNYLTLVADSTISNEAAAIAAGVLIYKQVPLQAAGTSGWSGYSGFSGYNGVSGWSGKSGFSGVNGLPGTSGFSGYKGTSGFSGYKGTSGFSGWSGYSGTIAVVSGETTVGTSGILGQVRVSGLSGYAFINTDGVSGWFGFSGVTL
jgi:hypothetical protein